MRHYKKTTVNLHLSQGPDTVNGCAFDAIGPIAMFVRAVSLTDVKGAVTPKIVVPSNIAEALEKIHVTPEVKQRGAHYTVDIMCRAVDPENPIWLGCVDFLTDFTLNAEKSLLIYFNEVISQIKEVVARFQRQHRPNTYEEQCRDVADFIRQHGASLAGFRSHYPTVDSKYHHSVSFSINEYGNWVVRLSIVENAAMKVVREDQITLAKLSFF